MKIMAILALSTGALIATSGWSADGSTKPAVQARLEAEANGNRSDGTVVVRTDTDRTIEVKSDERPINTSFDREEVRRERNDDNAVEFRKQSIDTPKENTSGTKPAVQHRLSNEQQ